MTTPGSGKLTAEEVFNSVAKKYLHDCSLDDMWPTFSKVIIMAMEEYAKQEAGAVPDPEKESITFESLRQGYINSFHLEKHLEAGYHFDELKRWFEPYMQSYKHYQFEIITLKDRIKELEEAAPELTRNQLRLAMDMGHSAAKLVSVENYIDYRERCLDNFHPAAPEAGVSKEDIERECVKFAEWMCGNGYISDDGVWYNISAPNVLEYDNTPITSLSLYKKYLTSPK